LRLPNNLNLFDGTVKTVVFNSLKGEETADIVYIKIDFNKKIIPQILRNLYQQNIQSLIVEGGKQLLESFIEANLWDEAFRFVGNKQFHNGIKAPQISGKIVHSEIIDSDQLIVYTNKV
jgi:diaminohydroxyphosphoribosylaminopyrimidine deaminase/5-amino-6-(5-phosphoribosylamino)uracil reductase